MEAPKGRGDRLGMGKEVCQGEPGSHCFPAAFPAPLHPASPHSLPPGFHSHLDLAPTLGEEREPISLFPTPHLHGGRAQQGAIGRGRMEGLSMACGRGLEGCGGCGGCGALTSLSCNCHHHLTILWDQGPLCQALEVEQGCLQRAMGPLEVSPEAFATEKEERLLGGECGEGLRKGVGPGRTQSKGMLEAGCLCLNPNSIVPSCVLVANCSTFLFLFLVYKVGMQ